MVVEDKEAVGEVEVDLIAIETLVRRTSGRSEVSPLGLKCEKLHRLDFPSWGHGTTLLGSFGL